MRRILTIHCFLLGCGDRGVSSSSNSGGDSTASDTSMASEATVSTSDTISGVSTHGESSEGGSTGALDTGGSADSAASSTTTGSASASDTGSSDDPFSQCAAAITEAECEGVAVESNVEFPQASCEWRDIYSVSFSDGALCSLIGTAPRCILFFGNLTGCGGGPSCLGAEGEPYLRDLETSVEVLFYPYDDICGPVPREPADEPDWVNCDGRGDHPACACICDVI